MSNPSEHIAVISRADFSYDPTDRPSGEETALEGVSLVIGQGEFVAVIGRNGSGKSTMARLLNALLIPTAGSVVIDGIDTRDGEGLWHVRSVCGMVFQEPDNQIVGSTVEEDVAFGPENLGLHPKAIEARVRNSLDAVSLGDLAERPPHLLSGGEKQRLALAGILAMHPKCIILDEATSMLDPGARESVMALLAKLNREEGITVVIITHRMEEALQADRIVVMDKGKVAIDGKPGEVFADAERIRGLGLELPPVVELFDRLRRDGFDLPKAVSEKDAIEALMALSSSGSFDVH